MSKKDYIAIATIIRQCRSYYRGTSKSNSEISSTTLVALLAKYFEDANPSFDRDKWIRACYTPLAK
jgi:hypothetical protein